MSVLKRYYLECTAGTSNKFYEVSIHEVSRSRYEVRTQYGRIGIATPNRGKGQSAWSYAAADRQANKIISQKQRKGYILKEEGKVPKPKGKKTKKKEPEARSRSLRRFTKLLGD